MTEVKLLIRAKMKRKSEPSEIKSIRHSDSELLNSTTYCMFSIFPRTSIWPNVDLTRLLIWKVWSDRRSGQNDGNQTCYLIGIATRKEWRTLATIDFRPTHCNLLLKILHIDSRHRRTLATIDSRHTVAKVLLWRESIVARVDCGESPPLESFKWSFSMIRPNWNLFIKKHSWQCQVGTFHLTWRTLRSFADDRRFDSIRMSKAPFPWVCCEIGFTNSIGPISIAICFKRCK